ncbi:MAG: DUF86 domain-containing protein [Spirochaetaceae bacterium]|nr:MAG: DUF86 domain-containing protein [Spirochaetaceae bacterium]
MLPENGDKAYIWDIVDAAKEILSFTENITYEEFDDKHIIRYAVERQLLVIGEAARHLSEKIKEAFFEIPWKQIVGLRNIIAHEYGEVLTERVWLVVKKDIPKLIDKLENYLE